MKYFWIVIAIIIAVILFFMSTNDNFLQSQMSVNIFNAYYYTILGLLCCTAILGMHIPMHHFLRSILIWISIFFILILGFANRYEIQSFASHLTAGLISANPVIQQTEEGLTVTLHRMRNGHFETRAQINNKEIQLMIDTGASAIVLSYKDAQKIGIKIENLNFTIPVNTANGKALSAATIIHEIKVGSIIRRNLHAMIAKKGALEGSLLGMNFLDRLSGYYVRGDRMLLLD